VSLLVPDERLARRLGTFTLLVMAATAACAVFLLDRVKLGTPTRIRVMFRHSAGLREHAALVVAGQPIGQIEAITPVLHGASAVLGGDVGVAVTVAIDDGSAWKVPASAEIFVSSRGPLSDKYLEVAPPTRPLGPPGPPVREGLELRGVDPPSLDNVLQHTWTNMTTFKLFMETIKPELAALQTQIGELRGQLDRLMDDPAAAGGIGALATEARALIATARQTYDGSLGGDAGLAHARATVASARQVIAQLRDAIDALGPMAAALGDNLARAGGHLAKSDPLARIDQTITAARAAIDKLDPLLAKVDELGARIAAGEGSLGRLIQDPEFPEDAKDLGKIIKRHPWRILERPPK
jgi:ABC-type transporter Mla subunit MlaD